MEELKDHLLEISGQMVDEQQLEPNDQANYKVKIKNISPWQVRNLAVWAHEDSDPAVQVTAGHQSFPDLNPGEEAERIYIVTCTGPEPGQYHIKLDVRYEFRARGEFQPFRTVPVTVVPD